MPDPTPDELLSIVADALELPGLTFDAEGDCIFVIEDKLELTLRRTENALFIFAPLFRYQPGSETALAREIARANYMWAGTGGATLGLNELDRSILMMDRRSLKALDPAMLKEWLDGFVRIGLYWLERLPGIERSAPREEEAAAAPAAEVPEAMAFVVRA